MSKIISRAFDPSKRVIRTIFQPHPSLLTANDLNRAFEQHLQAEKDFHSLVGVRVNRPQGAATVNSDNLSVSFSCDGMEYAGAHINGFSYEGSTYLPVGGSATLYADFTERKVTQADDLTISGAQFEDGTVMASADHEVIAGVSLGFTDNGGIPLIKFNRLSQDKLQVVRNYLDAGKSILTSIGEGALVGIDLEKGTTVEDGMTYNQAIANINNYLHDEEAYTNSVECSEGDCNLSFTLHKSFGQLSVGCLGGVVNFGVPRNSMFHTQVCGFSTAYNNAMEGYCFPAGKPSASFGKMNYGSSFGEYDCQFLPIGEVFSYTGFIGGTLCNHHIYLGRLEEGQYALILAATAISSTSESTFLDLTGLVSDGRLRVKFPAFYAALQLPRVTI